jgi:CubicO group peptidase (beta-lactamase class C family)
MISRKVAASIALLASLLAIPPTHADAALQTFLEQTLAAARAKDKLPAAAALVQINGKIEAEAAVGVRALGHPEPATVDDRWHIGSDTKALTATLIARLVEQRVMNFDDTLAASLPSLAKDMAPAYRTVTVAHLLTHTSGLPPLTDDKDLPPFMAAIATAK